MLQVKAWGYWLLIFPMMFCAACTPMAIPPTLTDAPSLTPRQLNTIAPTRAAQVIATMPTMLLSPTETLMQQISAATDTPPPLVFTARPRITQVTSISGDVMRVGTSAGGRDISALKFGNGERLLLLVGGIHGGWEANTVDLMRELGEHFAANPRDVLPNLSLIIIETMNPDGLAVGQSIEGRFNGNDVDLNRNWACGWQPDAVWREGPVDAGARAFSEPETQAMSTFILSIKPDAVLFYHSAADGIFAGNCPQRPGAEAISEKLSASYGEAADYSYGRGFSAYPVTGTAPSWVDGLGIASADVELSSARETQFERNLRGVIAAQCWILGIAADGLAGCA